MKDIISLQVWKGDITKLEVDCIVNAAHEALMGGGGVDGAIHRAAGPKLLQECRGIKEVERGVRCKVGEAHITDGYNLPCKYVIHTVAPVFVGSRVSKGLGDLSNWSLTSSIYKNAKVGSDDDLRNCYMNSLRVAEGKGCRSIGFPSLGTGGHSYPIELASKIAIGAVRDYVNLGTGIRKVIFVCFSDNDFEVYNEMLLN